MKPDEGRLAVFTRTGSARRERKHGSLGTFKHREPFVNNRWEWLAGFVLVGPKQDLQSAVKMSAINYSSYPCDPLDHIFLDASELDIVCTLCCRQVRQAITGQDVSYNQYFCTFFIVHEVVCKATSPRYASIAPLCAIFTSAC